MTNDEKIELVSMMIDGKLHTTPPHKLTHSEGNSATFYYSFCRNESEHSLHNWVCEICVKRKKDPWESK